VDLRSLTRCLSPHGQPCCASTPATCSQRCMPSHCVTSLLAPSGPGDIALCGRDYSAYRWLGAPCQQQHAAAKTGRERRRAASRLSALLHLHTIYTYTGVVRQALLSPGRGRGWLFRTAHINNAQKRRIAWRSIWRRRMWQQCAAGGGALGCRVAPWYGWTYLSRIMAGELTCLAQ